METVASCLQWAEHKLADASEELAVGCKADSQWLLCHVLGKSLTWLRTWPDQQLSPEQQEIFRSCVERRLNGEPVAYITGRQGFWTLDLSVNQHTLVPRPDTELLVELALALDDGRTLSVVDLGTGTGAIALALKSEKPHWKITATDMSAAALETAKQNADRFCLAVEFVESSWFDQLQQNKYHLIVSNPPYIEEDDSHLNGVGIRFEPKTALTSGIDGLDDIRKIISSAPHYMHAYGWLLLEHGYNQGKSVRDLLQQRGFANVRTEKDFGDNDRVTLGQWLEEVN